MQNHYLGFMERLEQKQNSMAVSLMFVPAPVSSVQTPVNLLVIARMICLLVCLRCVVNPFRTDF